jgi:antitoxin component of MazEF toxin-antitoxin module
MDIEVEIRKIGDSSGLILKKDILNHMGVGEGDKVIVRDEKGKKGNYISIFKPNKKVSVTEATELLRNEIKKLDNTNIEDNNSR